MNKKLTALFSALLIVAFALPVVLLKPRHRPPSRLPPQRCLQLRCRPRKRLQKRRLKRPPPKHRVPLRHLHRLAP